MVSLVERKGGAKTIPYQLSGLLVGQATEIWGLCWTNKCFFKVEKRTKHWKERKYHRRRGSLGRDITKQNSLETQKKKKKTYDIKEILGLKEKSTNLETRW